MCDANRKYVFCILGGTLAGCFLLAGICLVTGKPIPDFVGMTITGCVGGLFGIYQHKDKPTAETGNVSGDVTITEDTKP